VCEFWRRTDGTIASPESAENPGPVSLGWVPLGRDFSLEQRMLMQLRGRLGLVGSISAAAP